MTTTTNSVEKLSRPERRRLWKEKNKQIQYNESYFLDLSTYLPFVSKTTNKYLPHIGAKQRRKAT